MEIDIEKYISEEERHQIIRSVYIEKVREAAKEDVTRQLINTAYRIVYKAIDEALPENLEDLLKTKAIECINNVSAHTVFRSGSHWEKESEAHKLLQKLVSENKQVMNDKIVKLITDMQEYDVLSLLKDIYKDEAAA